MKSLATLSAHSKGIPEELKLLHTLEEIIRMLYDFSKYNLIEHSMTAYLLGEEKDILVKLPKTPNTIREGLATLFVARNEKLLKAIEILERRYKQRLKTTFPYPVIALDILLDKGLTDIARRLYRLLLDINIIEFNAPIEDEYIVWAILKRATRELKEKLSVGPFIRELDTPIRIMVDIAIMKSRDKLDYKEFKSVIKWINEQLSEEKYNEFYDDVEMLEIRVPPRLLFSPIQLYLVWKFLKNVLRFELVPPSRVLGENERQLLIKALERKKLLITLKIKVLNFIYDFQITIITILIMISLILLIKSLFFLFLPPFVSVIFEVGAKRYIEEKIRKIKNKIPWCSRIKEKIDTLQRELDQINQAIEKHTSSAYP